MFMQLSFTVLDYSFLCFDSDLALRNCLLTSEMSVKIGDYGLSHSRYKVRHLIMSFIFIDCFFAPSVLKYVLLLLFLLFYRMTTM